MNSFIKSLMEEKGLKQKDLAAILGISSSAISQWGEEVTHIGVDCLYSLSKLFHVTVDELIEGKRTGESLEDKWKREYNINEYCTSFYMDDKEELLQCLGTIAKANDRFFVLLERKIADKISDDEAKELDYLKQFYQIKTSRTHLFNNFFINRLPVNNINLMDIIKAKVGEENHAAVLWEMKNVCKIVDFQIDESILCDFEDDFFYEKDSEGNKKYIDKDIFYAWYNILTLDEKNRIINAEYKNNKGVDQRIDLLYELIKRGGNILYSPRNLNLINYDYDDMNGFEGEVKPVHELDKAQAVVREIYDNYSITTYEQYQALINLPQMRQIEMEAKYKEKNPIKYWEYIKSNEVLI